MRVQECVCLFFHIPFRQPLYCSIFYFEDIERFFSDTLNKMKVNHHINWTCFEWLRRIWTHRVVQKQFKEVLCDSENVFIKCPLYNKKKVIISFCRFFPGDSRIKSTLEWNDVRDSDSPHNVHYVLNFDESFDLCIRKSIIFLPNKIIKKKYSLLYIRLYLLCFDAIVNHFE